MLKDDKTSKGNEFDLSFNYGGRRGGQYCVFFRQERELKRDWAISKISKIYIYSSISYFYVLQMFKVQ